MTEPRFSVHVLTADDVDRMVEDALDNLDNPFVLGYIRGLQARIEELEAAAGEVDP